MNSLLTCRWTAISSVGLFFNDPATTEIYTLSLHDALPIWDRLGVDHLRWVCRHDSSRRGRSEEHTSELQSLRHIVCRLLLEKKKNPYEVDGQTLATKTRIQQLHTLAIIRYNIFTDNLSKVR